jgi:integrase
MPRPRTPDKITWRNGRAYAEYYDAETRRTKRRALGATDNVEATAKFLEWLKNGKRLFTGGSAGLTVAQALDDYRFEHVATKVIDKGRTEDAIAQLVGYFGHTQLSRVDIPLSRDYAEKRRTRSFVNDKRSRAAVDSTIRRELGTLVAAANHAMRWKRIQRNDLPVIELPPAYTVESLADDDWLTKDELRRAIEAAPGDLRHFIIIAYDSASRRAAVERLRRSQVDLPNSRVNLRGPDEDENQRRSKKRRPIVPISNFARPSYEALLNKTDTQWLFGQPKTWYKEFRRNMENIGLGHKRHPHILRHSRATHLLQDGVNIYAVAKLLGDTLGTVEKIYGHHSAEYLADAVQGRSL